MVDFPSILPTISRAIEKQNWTWRQVATGHLIGNKTAQALSKNGQPVSLFGWISTTFYGYLLYKKAESLGLFKHHSELVKPVQYGAMFVAAVNLYKVFEVIKSQGEFVFFNSANNKYRVDNPLWNLTPKAIALGNITAAVFDFKHRPLETVSFFTSGAVTLAQRHLNLFNEDTFKFYKVGAWIARANVFWTGKTPEQGFIALKVMKAFIAVASK